MAVKVSEEEDSKGKGKGTGAEKSNSPLMEDVPMTKEEIQKMIDDRATEMAAQLNSQGSSPDGNNNHLMQELIKAIAAGNSNNNNASLPSAAQFTFNNMYEVSQIDEDDFLPIEEQVTFVCPRVMHLIVDDKRQGKSIKAPFDVINFKYQSTKRVRGGKEVNVVNLSAYTCQSRTELKWLKNHTRFRIDFFDKVKMAVTADAEKATLISKQMNYLQGIGYNNLRQMAIQRGVESFDDINLLRAELAVKIAEEQYQGISQQKKSITHKLLADNVAEEKNVKAQGAVFPVN